MFPVFNVNGDPRLAHFYFKDLAGTVVDDFLVRSTLGEDEPTPGDDLSGEHPFLDTVTGSANTSLLDVDVAGGRLCAAGSVQGQDGAATVRFAYESLGSVDKIARDKVRGDFAAVSLTLDIRGKATTHSALEDIHEVGPKRRRQLLSHFGGLQGVKRAGIEELASVPGIDRRLAEQIFRSLH